MKILLALKQIEFAAKMFAAVGFNFSAAFEAKDENALKAHLDQAIAAAPAKTVEPTEEQLQALVVAELREELVASGLSVAAGEDPSARLKSALSAHVTLSARNALLETQLVASGIKLVAADAKAGLTAADVKAAVDARISMKAGELTAQLGTVPVGTQVSASPAIAPKLAAASTLTGLARVQAALEKK